jgi:hypothetical protein
LWDREERRAVAYINRQMFANEVLFIHAYKGERPTYEVRRCRPEEPHAHIEGPKR